MAMTEREIADALTEAMCAGLITGWSHSIKTGAWFTRANYGPTVELPRADVEHYVEMLRADWTEGA